MTPFPAAGLADAMNVVVAGVAGQPIFEVARSVVEAAHAAGAETSLSGNPDARPGRAVEAHARWQAGANHRGPLVMPGDCQVVLGLEALEALRVAARYFTPGMRVIAIRTEITPTSVLHRGRHYPDLDELAGVLREAGASVTWLDPPEAADAVAVLLGALLDHRGDRTRLRRR